MPLTDILLTSLVISLFCCGLFCITQEGNIGYFLRKPFENLIGWREMIMKPVILCPTCMASVWGAVIYTVTHYNYFDTLQLIICCISSAFLNEFFISLKEKIQS